ncbi:MAG: S1/P1 nuclease [Bacteroidaceae bacterium]|nr:S1/P1 nuclease [Bacteroidaceae bacterium]
MNKMNLLLKTLFVMVAAMTFSAPCFSWDKKGHDVTAAIAQRHLTKKAQKQIRELLDNKTIVYWAPWMDDASNTAEYRYSKTWHYLDISKGKDVMDFVGKEQSGDIIVAIGNLTETLKSKTATRAEKQLALKFLVHLLGDLHQPMHMGYPEDKGGNTVKVKFFNRETNLHSMWDGGMASKAHDWTHTEWAEEIDTHDKAYIAEVVKGTPYDWARQSHEYSEKIYDATPEGSNLSYEYVRTWTSLIEQQFLNGGLRLAHILNDIFK